VGKKRTATTAVLGLMLLATSAFAGGKAIVLSNEDMNQVYATGLGENPSHPEGQDDHPGPGKPGNGVHVGGHSQSYATGLVIQNLANSKSIVQINIGVSLGGNLHMVPSNSVVNSQN
jgi:hypothetical protein